MNSICKWKPSAIFPDNYEVSDFGDVKNTKGRILKPAKDKNGYLYYVLCVSGVRRTVKAHRLVAMTYIPNPNSKPAIDHINGVKTDNRIENLRWVTNKENTNNPITLSKVKEACVKRLPIMYQKSLKRNFGRKRVQVTFKDGTTIFYQSLLDASKDLKVSYGRLSERANGKRPQSKKFEVRYVKE